MGRRLNMMSSTFYQPRSALLLVDKVLTLILTYTFVLIVPKYYTIGPQKKGPIK